LTPVVLEQGSDVLVVGATFTEPEKVSKYRIAKNIYLIDNDNDNGIFANA
jgi:hypothetical protein